MNACRLCVGMREVAIIPARAANQRTTLSGVHSERAVMISCITNVYAHPAHPARIHDVPSQVKLTVTKIIRRGNKTLPRGKNKTPVWTKLEQITPT